VAVKHAVLTYEADPKTGQADGTFTLPRSQFLGGALAGADLSGQSTAGDKTALAKLLGMLTAPKPGFPIVTR
jgi:alkyl sulfatase BDS1-like metallo-beta-lactamase superfamily hydrolase